MAQRNPPEPPSELLWPNGAPGAVGTEALDKPSLTAWLPAKGNGLAVVVCPGGGYGALAMDHEGKQIAQWLNSQGIAAFVLKYRLGPRYHHLAPLADARQALKMVRTRGAALGIQKVGIWGFSAGGHLACSAATLFDGPDTRPDFAILAYPVITFTDEAQVHKGSRRNLLGDQPDPIARRGTLDRASRHRQHPAHPPLPHQRGQRRASGKQHPVLSGLPQGWRARRDAHLRTRPPRGRLGLN